MKNSALPAIFLALSLISLTNTAQAQDDFAIIVNKNVEEGSLSADALRRIYFGFDTEWENVQKIRVSYQHFSNAEFWQFLSTSETNYKRFWSKKELSGNGTAPVAMTNGESIIDFVSNTEGAIGIIQKELIEQIGEDCRMLEIAD